MSMSEPRPFTAATSKFAYAQAFAGPSARRHASRGSRVSIARGLAAFRGRHKVSRHA